jgi:hypothetical protein
LDIFPGKTGNAVSFIADTSLKFLRRFDMPKTPNPSDNDPAPKSFRNSRLENGLSFKLS